MREFTSPLMAWEGSFSLPSPDDFSGTHWKAWKEATKLPLRSSYSETHFYGYAGLQLVDKCGEWNIKRVIERDEKGEVVKSEPLPLEEVRAWETDPDKERVKLISWIGKQVKYYHAGIIDPKE